MPHRSRGRHLPCIVPVSVGGALARVRGLTDLRHWGGTRAVQTFGPDRARARGAPHHPQPQRHREPDRGSPDDRTARRRDTRNLGKQVSSSRRPTGSCPDVSYGPVPVRSTIATPSTSVSTLWLPRVAWHRPCAVAAPFFFCFREFFLSAHWGAPCRTMPGHAAAQFTVQFRTFHVRSWTYSLI